MKYIARWGILTGFLVSYTGNLYAENIDPDNDGSQYAYAENVGWLNFSPTYGGVTIDLDGNFDGWAWGENIGWINFNSLDLYNYNVKVCVVNYYDLANFVDDWLKSGPNWPADLYSDQNVDFKDYSIFADYWRDYCPDAWPLK